MKTMVLADDHPIIRQGVRSLLEVEPDLKIIGEAGDGDTAIEIVEKMRPDVLVLDLMMGGTNGLEVTRQVCKCSPETRIVILSMHSTESYVIAALKAGAKAYVLKEASSDELVIAVRTVIDGQRYLSSALSEKVIEQYARGNSAPASANAVLTAREREVLPMVVQGFTSTEIAEHLFISARTVDVHRYNMMRKLGVKTQSELVRYAIQQGILQP